MNTGNLTLRRRGAEYFKGWRFFLVFVAAATSVAFIQFSMLDLGHLTGFYSTLNEEGWHRYWQLLAAPIGAFFVVPFLARLGFRGRIEITQVGITHSSELPEFLRSLRPNWRYEWSQIDSAVLSEPSIANPLLSPLIFRVNQKTIRFVPWQWVDRDKHETSTSGQTVNPIWKNKEHLKLLVADTPLVKAFKDHGKIVSDEQLDSTVDDSIDGSMAAQFVAVCFVAFVIYFVIDTYFGLTEYYAGAIPWQLHVTAGLGGYGIAAFILHRAKQFAGQGKLMAMLFGLGISLAAYPFLIRANAWTDNGELTGHVYTLHSNNIWEADETVPNLTFDIGSGYWQQFEPGDTKTFELRRGGLGFYQVNMQPIYAEQKAFYQSQ